MTAMPVDIRALTAVRKLALQAPGWTALRYQERQLSYGELADIAERLAAVLAEGGVGRGDRVAYLGRNSPAFVYTFLAASWLGAVFVPVNFLLSAAEVAQVLADSGTHTVVAEQGHQEIVDAVADQAAVRRCLLGDDDIAVPVAGERAAHWTRIGPASARAVAPGAPVPCAPDDLAMLMYTSGTTGRPKGVRLSHGNLWWNGVNLDATVACHPGDVNLVVNPLFHTAPLGCFTLRALTRGGTTVIRREFDAARTLADLVELRVNTFFAVPAVFEAIAREPGFATADLSALHSAVTAGAPVEPKLIDRYARRGVLLQQGWGLTEVLFGSMLPTTRTLTKIGSAGQPMVHTTLRINDTQTGREITASGERGEVWVRSPSVSSGYWNNPEATAEAFAPDGWFRTGDIGQLDDDGCLFIVDRLKDMVIVGGHNVHPAEVQLVLGEYPGVFESAVVGMPDPVLGERVVALVVCEDGVQAPSLPKLREFAGLRLAEYKLPTRLHVVTELPRNVMGKIDKAMIRDALVAGDLDSLRPVGPARTSVPATPQMETVQASDQPQTELVTPESPLREEWTERLTGLPGPRQYRVLLDLVRTTVAEMLELSGPTAVEPGQQFTHLGLDSLSAVELLKRLGETTGLRLPSTLVFARPTCDALARHLQSVFALSDVPVLRAELDRLEAALASSPLGPADRDRLAVRLRGLLADLGPGEGPPAAWSDSAMTDASDEDLFDLIDRGPGSA